MDVFEAVNSRIACRRFLDRPVDPNIVRNLIEGPARVASNGNLQPWNVHAVTGESLKEIKRQAADAPEKGDWRTTEYPAACTENSVRVDLVIESPNVSDDGRVALENTAGIDAGLAVGADRIHN